MLKNREELIKFAASRGARFTAEIGVFSGLFSEVICRNIPNVDHICVDVWQPTRNHKNIHNIKKALENARCILAPYKVRFMEMDSVEASKLIPDESLDLVYIDASHDYKSVLSDITHWEPKVRPGGIVSGHDYGTEHHQTRSVKAAVDEFYKRISNDPVSVTGFYDKEAAPSWYWIK